MFYQSCLCGLGKILFIIKLNEKHNRNEMLAIFAVGLSANIVLLSVSFVLCRVPHSIALRTRNGVENFLVYRFRYENMCTYFNSFFWTEEWLILISRLILFGSETVSAQAVFFFLIVAGGTFCFAMRDL